MRDLTNSYSPRRDHIAVAQRIIVLLVSWLCILSCSQLADPAPVADPAPRSEGVLRVSPDLNSIEITDTVQFVANVVQPSGGATN